MNPKEEYQAIRRQACQDLFAAFVPDFSKCKDPELAKKVLALASEGLYTKDIAELVGKTPKAIQKIYRRYNFPALQNFCPPRMEQRPDWKHGQKMMKGYIYQRTPGHPHSTKHGGYVALHRLVLEKKLGRYLLSSEVVDHIDGDITNNDPDNLRVFESNAKHLSETRQGQCPNWTAEGRCRLRKAAEKRYKLPGAKERGYATVSSQF